jgi:aldose sugar dehydrogenase
MSQPMPKNCLSYALTVTTALMLLTASSAGAIDLVQNTERGKIRLVTLAKGLEIPWGMAFLPDGRMLVTERPGRLRVVAPTGAIDPAPVSGLPDIVASGQGGLLDVVLHPKFAENQLVYFSYAGEGTGGIGTEVARGRFVSDQRGHRLHDVTVIYRQQPKSRKSLHFGARLVFDRNGLLYITQGDRGDMERAQLPTDLAGKVVRLNDDGSVPGSNPFSQQKGSRPEIFSSGHRNVQGAALHPTTGELWAHEHGPQGGDEINVVRAGLNYGWPVITYGANYVTGTRIGEGTHKDGMVQPIYQWTPSIAPAGMAFYTGKPFPQWQGNLFVGALKYRMLVRLELEGEKVLREERLFENKIGRIRDVRQGPDGLIYLLTDAANGELLRLEPAK